MGLKYRLLASNRIKQIQANSDSSTPINTLPTRLYHPTHLRLLLHSCLINTSLKVLIKLIALNSVSDFKPRITKYQEPKIKVKIRKDKFEGSIFLYILFSTCIIPHNACHPCRMSQHLQFFETFLLLLQKRTIFYSYLRRGL